MRKTLIAFAILAAVAACRGDHDESNGSTDTIKTGQPVTKKASPPASSTGNSSGSGSTGTSGTLPNGTTNGTAT